MHNAKCDENDLTSREVCFRCIRSNKKDLFARNIELLWVGLG